VKGFPAAIEINAIMNNAKYPRKLGFSTNSPKSSMYVAADAAAKYASDVRSIGLNSLRRA